MNLPERKRSLAFGLGLVWASAAFCTGGVGHHADSSSGKAPPFWRLAPAQQEPEQDRTAWNSTATKSPDGYHIISITNLNGKPGGQTDFVEIANGRFQNWRWSVKVESSLLPSWNAYERSGRVKKTAQLAPDDWGHPAFDWGRAFGRAYLAIRYLLGRQPIALNATVLLIPDGQEYRAHFDQVDAGTVPITLGFPFPTDTSASKPEQAKRMTTILQAITELAHQYGRVLVDENLVPTKGQDETSKTVNKEADGACWMESTDLVFMAAGGNFRSTLQWSQQTSADDLARHPPSKIPPGEIGYWASLREAESISGYLEMKGLKNRNFSGKDPAAMNAVLSVCRAMTQRAIDLTAGPYPPAQILYVPFFPNRLK